MILAVDYDGTLEIDGQMNRSLISRLRTAQANGDCVILWTCRNGDRLRQAVANLARVGFRPNYINCNTPATIARLGYDPRKVLADVYIDNKAVR